MEFEFMTINTPLPPCMPLPIAALRLPISSTAKIMYARLLDAALMAGREDMKRDFICPLSHHGAVGGAVPQPHDREAFPERTGTRRADYAGTARRRGAKPHLYFDSGKGGRRP